MTKAREKMSENLVTKDNSINICYSSIVGELLLLHERALMIGRHLITEITKQNNKREYQRDQTYPYTNFDTFSGTSLSLYFTHTFGLFYSF